jgi:transposase
MLYIGIDVAKNKHDCCILSSDGIELCPTFSFQNNREGFDFLLSKISAFSCDKTLSDTRIGLESTGHYSINIANFLLQKRLCVKIFNPLHVSLMRKASTLRKTKTDKSDSKFLASLMFYDNSKPYSPPLYQISELKQLSRSRQRLIAMRSKLKLSVSRLITLLFPELPDCVYSVNQKSCYALLLTYPTAKAIAAAHLTALTNLLSINSNGKYGKDKARQLRSMASCSIGLDSRAVGFELQQTIRLIQSLQEEISLLDTEIKSVMDELDSPVLSIPGIGYTLGAIILSEIGNIENFKNPAKLLAFAGLEPSCYQSGNYQANKTPMVKRGSPYLRWALLQAARLVSMRDKTFHDYLEKKRSEGKHFFVAQSHAAKKLVRVLFYLLKNEEPFQAQTA